MKEGSELTFGTAETSRPVSLSLLGWLALSVLIHAVSFYLFQLTYPPLVHLNPPPAQVSFLTPSSLENAALLRWIESENPALISQPQETLPPGLFDLPYQPSFAEIHALPKTVDKQPPTLVYPPALDPISLVRHALPRQETPVAELPAPRTRLRFGGALARRTLKNESQSHLAAQQNFKELHPARFLVGVSDRGEVRYVFLQNSSGDKALDAQADAHVQQLEFDQSPEPMAWGFVIFAWGSDAFVTSQSSP